MNIGKRGLWWWAGRGVAVAAAALLLGACQQATVPLPDAAPPPPDVAALAASASAAAPRSAGTASAAMPAAAASGADAGDTASARAAVIDAIGSAACTEDTQCRTVGLGSRACGGPEEWVAWSTSGDAARIEAAAARQRASRKAEVEARGMMGTCAVLPDPGARCRAGRCEPVQQP